MTRGFEAMLGELTQLQPLVQLVARAELMGIDLVVLIVNLM